MRNNLLTKLSLLATFLTFIVATPLSAGLWTHTEADGSASEIAKIDMSIFTGQFSIEKITADFPDPYCEVTGNSNVEPITRVIFSDIDNSSSAASTIPHEDFTSVVGNVEPGTTYTITVEGYTGGNWTNRVAVWIDWNQDDVFDETTERYNIVDPLVNSTGVDGQQISTNITVPAGALSGETRMRVMKKFSSLPNDSCTSGSSYGQAEDYTINVDGGGSGSSDPCDDKIAMDCGVEYTATLVPGAGAWTNYTGVTYTYTGLEQVFEFTAPEAGDYEFYVDEGFDDADFFFMDGCSNTAGNLLIDDYVDGWLGETITFTMTAGETIYVIADLYEFSNSTTVTVEVTCPTGGGGPSSCSDITIGEGGTATSSYIPIYYLYDYSYSQAIYTAAELQATGAGAGNINQIAYMPNSSVSTVDWRNWTIYMGNTTKDSFSGNSDWMTVTGNMQEVFSGDIPDNVVAGEWMEIDLDTSFAWDGTSNIVIAVVDNTDGWGGSPSWKGYNAGSNRGIYVYRDNTPYDVDNPGNANNTTTTLPMIKFCGDLLPNCVDADAGVIDGPAISCPLTSFTLEAVGASDGETGLVRQWQSSPDGTAWTDIAGETNPTLNTEITDPTYFRYVVECDFGGSSDTTATHFVDVNTNANECYCVPVGTNSTYAINDFSTTGGGENISNMGSGFSPDGYGNFYDTHSVQQDLGGSIDFEAVNDPSTYTYGFRIWVDWNQDGVFDPATEMVWSSSGYANTHTGTIDVPADAVEGETRMRIANHYLNSQGNVDPCSDNHTYGEFEDYKFIVGDAGEPDDYCIPEGDSFFDWIESFSTTGGVENINNVSGNNGGYGDFYDTHNVTQEQGEDVSFAAVFSDGFDTYGFRIWVDWNQDGVFDTTEEVAWASSGYATSHSGSFTVPSDAALGSTRMRIVNSYGSFSGNEDPCDTTLDVWGEYEDYKFTVVEGDNGGGDSDCITTLFASNNGGGAGWGQFFDVTVKGNDLSINSIDINTSANGDAINLDVYIIEGGTYMGNELNAAAWGAPVSTGTGTGMGDNNPTEITLNTPIELNANEDYAFAIFFDASSRYTNGTGANQYYENDDLELNLGASTSGTFSGSVFADRIFNGTLCYDIGGGGQPDPGDDCEQDYYVSGTNPANYDNGLNITNTTTVFWGANDVVVEAGENFKLETITFDAISLAGNPTDFTIQIHEDNGSGGVGDPVGPAYVLNSTDYTYTTSGSYSGFDVFRMVFDMSGEDINFDNTSGTDVAYWWIAIQAESTSAASSLFWLVDFHDGNPSNLMWQFDGSVWAENDSDYEGAMKVEGTCSDNGGGGSAECSNVIIGEGGSSTSSYIPIYYLYDYSYSQSIYTAAELQATGAGAGDITQIAYMPTASVSTVEWRNWTIYMGNTTKDSFSGNSDWMTVTGNMQEVFSGDLANDTVAGEWLEIDLDSSFAWDGTSNIVIAVVDNTDGWGGSPNWRGYASGSDRGIYLYRDNNPIDVDNPGTGTGNNVTATLPQIKFCGDLLPNCADADAGVIDGPAIACAHAPFTLEAVGASYGETGLVTQWQSSPDGTAWTDIAGETNIELYTTITEPTYFRYVVECDFGGSDTSDAHFVDLNTVASECYCIPEGTNAARYIDNFSTTGGTDNISNMGSGFSAGGYGDFYDTHGVTQAQGSDVSFEVNIEGGTAGFRVWVDWNQDGFFDTTEEVAWNSSSYQTSHSGTFTVPADADLGDTRMRIVSHWLSTTGDVDPCATDFTYGEFEDYRFTVTEGNGGGDPEDCEIDFPYSNANGSGNVVTLLWADDFEVETGTTMHVDRVSLRMFNDIGDATTLAIHEDNGGEPGAVVESFSNVAYDSQVVIDNNFSMDIYDIEFTLPATVDLDAGVYWFLIQVSEGADSGTRYWVITEDTQYGQPGKYSDDGGATWTTNSSSLNYSFTLEGECEEEGGSSGEDCDQGDDSNGVDDGFNITAGGTWRNADDFFVSAGNSLNIQQIELNVLSNDPINNMTFTFYEDDGNSPGDVMPAYTQTNIPVDAVIIGNAFGFDVYAVFADVDLTFTEGHYWMQPEAHVGVAYWEMTEIGTLGEPVHTSEAGGAWEADVDGMQGVFKLRCEPVDPPDVPCLLDVIIAEPITRVVMANVDNPSDANSSVTYEDFTHIEIEVAAGSSYDVALEGNTDGDWTNYFTIFVDTSTDGEWNDYLTYEIGSITNSTGTDGQQATNVVTIPADLANGSYTLRVIKNFGSSPLSPCGTYTFGQAEDYTLVVGDGDPNDDECEQGIGSMSDIANAYNIEMSNSFHTADDFIVDAGIEFDLATISIDTNQQELPDDIVINIREDDAGQPGFIIHTLTFDENGYDWEIVGTAYGDPIYNMVFTLDTPLTFTEGTYWIDPKMSTPGGETVWWAATDAASHESLPYRSTDGGNLWEVDDNGLNMIMSVSGICRTLGLGELSSFDFTYYPNPVKDVLYINSSKKVESVQVYNLAGQEVMKQSKQLSTANQIDVTTLPSGVYLFRAVLEGGVVENFKVIKK